LARRIDRAANAGRVLVAHAPCILDIGNRRSRRLAAAKVIVRGAKSRPAFGRLAGSRMPRQRCGAVSVRYFGAGPDEHRSSQRRPTARTGLTTDPPGRRLAPFGQLREALARHNARLNANSSVICCSRSIKASKPREIDSVQIDIKYPTAMGVLEHKTPKCAAHFSGSRPQTLGNRRPYFRRLTLQIAAP
jgi:hypothetical protein